MKTYIVRVVLTQHFEQRIEAEDPHEAQQKAVEAAGSADPISVTFESTTTPVELAYEG